MAIPFNLPSDEETAENYRRLDQLLLDLYEILRQILLRRRIERVIRQPQPQGPPPPQQQGQPDLLQQPRTMRSPRAQLPDVVPQGRRPPVPPPRRRRRRPLKPHGQLQPRMASAMQVQPNPPTAPQSQQGPSWVNVGIELRQIAEEFRSNSQILEGEEKKRSEIKASSLFSLLVPAPLTGSIWTTVIILVGWRILARHR